MIHLINAKNGDKIQNWIKILKSNSGSCKLTDNKIFITSNIFIQLIDMDINTTTIESQLLWIKYQEYYLNTYEYVQISY